MLPVRRHQTSSSTFHVDGDDDKQSSAQSGGEVTLSKKNMHKFLGNHKSLDWFIRVWREQDGKIMRSGEVAPE